jgi:small subunit ribosomal protein S21
MKVIISDGKFEKGIRLFKKKVDDLGILKDLKEKEFYTKPSVARKLKKSAAKKRWQKFVESTKLPERKY